MQPGAYFASLARYHVWATRRLLDEHLPPLSDEEWHRDCGLYFRSIHGTLNHLLVTDTLWHARFAEGRSPRIALDAELHTGRDALVLALREAVVRWTPWLDGVPPARFEGELSYERNNGEQVRIPFTPALGHVFNHATHHRGQVSAGLTTMAHPGPELDWVQLLRHEAR